MGAVRGATPGWSAGLPVCDVPTREISDELLSAGDGRYGQLAEEALGGDA